MAPATSRRWTTTPCRLPCRDWSPTRSFKGFGAWGEPEGPAGIRCNRRCTLPATAPWLPVLAPAPAAARPRACPRLGVEGAGLRPPGLLRCPGLLLLGGVNHGREKRQRHASKDEIVARVWPTTVVVESNLRVHMTALRKALGDEGHGRDGHRYIVTVPNRGYSFVAPVSRSPAEAPSAVHAGATDAYPNLLAPLHRIVGRDAAIDSLSRRVRRHRLVTLVGAGGIACCTPFSTGATAAFAAQACRTRASLGVPRQLHARLRRCGRCRRFVDACGRLRRRDGADHEVASGGGCERGRCVLPCAERSLAEADVARASFLSGAQIDRHVAMGTILTRVLWLQGLPDQAEAMAARTVDRARNPKCQSTAGEP